MIFPTFSRRINVTDEYGNNFLVPESDTMFYDTPIGYTAVNSMYNPKYPAYGVFGGSTIGTFLRHNAGNYTYEEQLEMLKERDKAEEFEALTNQYLNTDYPNLNEENYYKAGEEQ